MRGYWGLGALGGFLSVREQLTVPRKVGAKRGDTVWKRWPIPSEARGTRIMIRRANTGSVRGHGGLHRP